MKKRVIIAFMAIIILCVSSGCGSSAGINLEESTYFGVYGYNGYGDFTASFDSSGVFNTIWDGTSEQQTQITNFANSVKYDYNVPEYLKNGDKINIVASWNESIASSLKLKITHAKFTVTVEGLEEPQTISISDIYDVGFIRNSGIELKSKIYISGFKVSCDELPGVEIIGDIIKSDLHNGQIITLRADYDRVMLAKAGYRLENDTETFTVSGLPVENVDYIVIQGKEYSTDLESLSLNYRYTNADIEPLKYMKNLKELDLSMNDLSDINPLAELTSLTRLDLEGSKITDISALAGLTNLTYLDIGNNQIEDISVLSGLKELSKLSIRYNRISDISALSELSKLKILIWGGNLFHDNRFDSEQINELKAILKDCEFELSGYLSWR